MELSEVKKDLIWNKIGMCERICTRCPVAPAAAPPQARGACSCFNICLHIISSNLSLHKVAYFMFQFSKVKLPPLVPLLRIDKKVTVSLLPLRKRRNFLLDFLDGHFTTGSFRYNFLKQSLCALTTYMLLL